MLSSTKILARLVGFDTTSHKSNIALVDFVDAYLRGLGVDSTRVVNEAGDKANLFATIGRTDIGGVALSGHTDVVPVDGQIWDSDPFELRAADGKLYGRGAADMKGFLACVLAAVPDFLQRKLKTPIHLAFSYDEEIGCVGVRPMIAEFGRSLVTPRLAIVGEPTLMQVVDAHKGPVRWRVEVTGRPAHSSMPQLGVNAVTYAGRLIGELERIEADLKSQTIDARFAPPHTSLQITRIDGGVASNIVPASCVFGFEIRATPGLDPSTVESALRRFAETHCLPDMRSVAPEADITIERTNSVPPFAAGSASEAVALAMKFAGQNQTHAVSYATEAGLFQNAGSPAVICGPGDIAQAHTANEWIEESQLAACAKFLDSLAEWASEN